MYIILQSGGVIDLFLTERSIKDGFCPVIKEPRTGSCTSKCSSDDDCKEMQKCCNVTGCGKTCQEPSFTSRQDHKLNLFNEFSYMYTHFCCTLYWKVNQINCPLLLSSTNFVSDTGSSSLLRHSYYLPKRRWLSFFSEKMML